ncbi:carbohydrate ABC transporter permease [Natronosalvus halobius]|uniref:carbohydrate ABC transporter permease n=1 Tax=Natronosalvus halobius TaxID=2953746 RepID=UPI0020A2300D|nr:sugar ABC transporter permease [Natronosalvus halobius]USZ70232.1 sugar ABC transporter permease [Natronosalvus halobius]
MSLSSVGARSRDGYRAIVPESTQEWISENSALLLVLPGLFFFSLFMFFPLLFTIYLSFTDAEPATVFQDGPGGITGFFGLRGVENFVGLENYVSVLSDPAFWNSLGITWLFVAISVTLKVAFGLFLAMLVTSDRVRGKRYLRSIIIIPWALPPIFTITIWRGVFSSARFGLANQAIAVFGMAPKSWFNDRWLAFGTYLLTEMWLAYPFMVIITVSALQAVPDDLIDAAKVDGAGFVHRFLNVTVPSIKRPVMFAAILTAAASFTQFLIPYVFNRGGPGRANELIILYGYREAFTFDAYGAGAAIMMTAVVFIGIFMLAAVWKGQLAEGVN